MRQVLETLRCSLGVIESVRDEEDECLSNFPENLASSLAAVKMEDAVDALSEAYSLVSDAIEQIEGVI